MCETRYRGDGLAVWTLGSAFLEAGYMFYPGRGSPFARTETGHESLDRGAPQPGGPPVLKAALVPFAFPYATG